METNSTRKQLESVKRSPASPAHGASAQQASAERVRVLLADDHTIVREGLRALLNAIGTVEVVGEAEHGRLAVSLAKATRPDVVLMDIAMPLLNGTEATRQILNGVPGARVLAMSSYTDEEAVLRMVEAGAAGYVLKQTAAEELVRAIQEVAQGKSFFSAAVARVLPQPIPRVWRQGRPDHLSAREMEVLQLIAEGWVNKQIAWELKISTKTVEKHRQALINKLNLHDTAKLTRYAVAEGLVECRAMAGMGVS